MTQQKGRRVPFHLQTAVKAEIAELIKEGHIRRIDKTNDDVFIQPTVTTVKRDKTVKVALDARQLNNAIQKDKHQMPNLDNVMEQVAEIVKSKSERSVRFTSLDMQYAYGQTELHPDTAKHCNFQIIRRKATGTYTFITGFYGLTTISTEFQKIMDKILHNVRNTFTFIVDILVVTKGSKIGHIKQVENVMKILDKAGIRLKEEKCQIAQSETIARIYAHGDRGETNRQQSPSHIRQGKATKSEGSAIIHGRDKPEEPVYRKPNEIVRSAETSPEQRYKMGIESRTRSSI